LLATGLIGPSLHAQYYTFTTIAGGPQGSANAFNLNAQSEYLTGVGADGAGNVYVADQNNNLILRINPLGANWIVTAIAGGGPGSLDGTNSSAQFSGPTGIAVDSSGNLYVADLYNDIIRKITPAGTNWVVSTIAGKAGLPGYQNGTNGGARFSDPTGIAVDGGGNIIVADEGNNAIRKITPAGTNWIVTTIAGGVWGDNDGTNTAAQFRGPYGVAVDTGGRVFVADQFNDAIRLITPMGTNWVVTTIAGQPMSGLSNGLGTNAEFDVPVSVAVDTNGNVYVADLFNDAIRELTPSGSNWMVSTIGGGSQGSADGTGANASFNLPYGVAVDAYGDVYVADAQNNAIRMGLSTNSPLPTGGLEVMIAPSNAISGGAAWQFDGGTPQTNGALLSGLVPGNHAISFNNIAGFTTPAVQTVPVTAHQTTLLTGNYAVAIANAGSLQVMISPAGAMNAGAQWQAGGSVWQTNGAIVTGLPVGPQSVSFLPISGWTAPSSQMVNITNGQTTLAAGTYVLQTGSLQVTILPAAVVTSGAKWQVDGGMFQASGATFSGLLPGTHTIGFNTVLGGTLLAWQTPSSQVVTISNALTNSVTAIYTQPPQLAGMAAAGGGFQLVLKGLVGSNYVIQASSNLLAWTSISIKTIPTNGSVTIVDPNVANYSRRFYRAASILLTPLQLTGMTLSNGTAQFVVNGQSGSGCVIQASSNLVSWSPILSNTIPEAGIMLTTDTGAANQNRRFYRAVRQ
jgi:streptogramin lyase